MKVWQVVRPTQGGLKSYIRSLLPALRNRGLDVVLVGPEPLGAETMLWCPIGDRILPGRELAAIRRLRQLARRVAPDVVHAHGTKAALLARLALRGRYPLVYSLHGLPRSGFHIRAAERLLSRWTGLYLAPTAAVAQRAAAAWGLKPEQVMISPFGPDPARLHGLLKARRTPPCPHSPVRVALVARLVPEKGLDVLLEAMDLLADRPGIPAFRVKVAGDGPLMDWFRSRTAEPRRSAPIDILGQLPPEETDELLLSSQIFVLPSRAEALGLAALEAMAAGCAVVVSDAGGLPESAGQEAALSFVSGEPGSLADRLEVLLRNPDLREDMGRRARRIAGSRFPFEKHTSQLDAAYRELVGHGR